MAGTPALWRPETQVNTTDAAAGAGGNAFQGDGQIVGLGDGGYVVVWTDGSHAHNPEGNAVVGQRYDALGERVGGEFVISPSLDSPQSSPAIAALPGGGVAVAFVDLFSLNNDILVRRYDANLNFVGTDAIDIGANQTVDPSITAFADGSYVVSYTVGSGADTDIVARLVSATGVVGPQFGIHDEADNSDFSELATLSNGNFVAVYRDEVDGSPANTDIMFRILRADGTGVTGSTTVSGGGFSPAAETDPDVAALAGGGFVVVWSEIPTGFDGLRIGATIYDNAGNLVSSNIQVNAIGVTSQNEASVVALSDGGFLVTWEDDSADLVRARRFDAIGNPGSEFVVRNGVATDSPEAALLLDGRFAYALGDVSSGDSDVVTSIWGTGNNVATVGDVLWRHDDGAVATADHDLGTVPNTWRIAGTGDFDADGDTDILWRHTDGLVVTWEMENGQLLTNHTLPNASTGWEIVDTGDFDADGDADVLWRHSEGAVVTWEMANGQYVVNHNITFASTGWEIDGLGDFDADGDDDLIWRHQEGAVVTWEMEDGEYVQNHNIAFGSTSWQIQGTGDFDADGDDDILWRHDEGAVVTWEMQGGNYVTNHNLPSAETAWQISGTGDFDADGTDDILWRHTDGTVVTWDMDGGELLQVHNFGVVPNAWQIQATGEFDLA